MTTLPTHVDGDTDGVPVCALDDLLARADGVGSVWTLSHVDGCRYHMSDAIGAGALVSTKTTMGPLLRLPDPD